MYSRFYSYRKERTHAHAYTVGEVISLVMHHGYNVKHKCYYMLNSQVFYVFTEFPESSDHQKNHQICFALQALLRELTNHLTKTMI